MGCSCSYSYEIHEKIKSTRKRYGGYFAGSAGPGPQCDVPPSYNPRPYTAKISQTPKEGGQDPVSEILDRKTVPENAADACANCSCNCTAGDPRKEPDPPRWTTVKEYKEKITILFDSRVKYTLVQGSPDRDASCGTFEEEHEVDVEDQEMEYTLITPYSCQCTCESKK